MQNLIKISNSFMSFDTMYELLTQTDYSCLNRECGTTNYPEIQWMIEYFAKKEEYEKCAFLAQLKLPMPLSDKLNAEIEYLKSK